jgi:ATP/ADP translocase/HEAT repeat protein
LRQRLATALGIGSGEWSRLLAMGGLFFWVMLGWAMGRSGRDAYFIKEVGPEHLPYMYILSAVLMVGISGGYTAVVDRMERFRLMVGLLACSAAILVGLRVLMPLELVWTPYAVFSLAEVFTLFFLMHFWTFANSAFDPREGKRLFPLIGGAGLLGGFAGGLLTRPLVHWLGTADLFLAWAAILVLAVPLTLVAQHASRVMQAQGAPAEVGGLLETFAYIRRVPLLRTLTYLSVPMWLVVYIVDYQFFLVMDEVFPGQDQLTGFLGVFNSVTALIGLGLQLFVTGWVLRRFGVGRAVWVHPLGMSLGALALAGRALLPALPTPRFFSFSVLSGVFAKFSDNAIFYSIGEASSQLLFNALPEQWRGRGRAYISGVVEPVCTALAGGLLLAFQAFEVPAALLSCSVLILCALWLGWTRRLKGEYLRALAANLSDADPRRSAEAWQALGRHGGGTAEVLLESVANAEPEVALLALELLGRDRGKEVAQHLAQLLQQVRAPVQLAILDELVRREDTSVLPLVEALEQNQDAAVRAAVVRTRRILGVGAADLVGGLDDTNPGVRAEAVVAHLVAGEARGVAVLEQMLGGDVSSRERGLYAVEVAAARQALPIVLGLCADSDVTVRRRCAAALVQAGGADAAAALVGMLSDAGCALAAQDGLKALGEDAVPLLLQAWDEADDEARSGIARCLAGAMRPEAGALLVRGVNDPSPMVKVASAASLATRGMPDSGDREMLQKALLSMAQHLAQLDQWCNDLEGTEAGLLLCDALGRQADEVEAVALRCVAALGEADAVRVAAANLNNPQSRVRAEAIEVIESSTEAAHGLVRELERRHLAVNAPEPMPLRALAQLCQSRLPLWERACLLYALRCLEAVDLEAGLADEETQNMAVNIERILFLKSASLFADVAGSDLPWIDAIAREKEYEAGEVVFRDGETGDSLYIIVEGQVRVLKGEDKPVVLAVLDERDCFGEMALLDGEPRSATVQTQSRTRLLEIARAEFEELLLGRPQIGFALIKNLNRRLRETNARLMEKGG